MKSPEIVQQVRQIPIVDYLASIDIMPAYKAGHELFYCSPITNEKTPSLAVNPSKNAFYDWSGNGKGDILSLVQYINGYTFLEAVSALEKYLLSPCSNSLSFCGQSSLSKDSSVEIIDVIPLQHKALIQYVQKRGISFEIAFRHLKEIHYTVKGKKYFAICFQNDSLGFEVRNPYFKGSFTPKTITSIIVKESDTLLLFEGFFDFLSALEYYKKTVFPANVIVLNSLVNLTNTLSELSRYRKISVFMDTDGSGRKAIEKVKTVNSNVIDYSYIYKDFKDFNEMLCSRSKHQ